MSIQVDIEQVVATKSMLAKLNAVSLKNEKQVNSGITMIAVHNPFNNVLNVSFKSLEIPANGKQNFSLTLLDANGKIVSTQTILGLTATARLQTTSYAPGMYLLTLKGTDGALQSTKVIKINQ